MTMIWLAFAPTHPMGEGAFYHSVIKQQRGRQLERFCSYTPEYVAREQMRSIDI